MVPGKCYAISDGDRAGDPKKMVVGSLVTQNVDPPMSVQH